MGMLQRREEKRREDRWGVCSSSCSIFLFLQLFSLSFFFCLSNLKDKINPFLSLFVCVFILVPRVVCC